jgi:TAP-like protein
VLLTYHGEGHIAFGRESKSSCIDNAVDAYFLTLALPAAGTTCQPDGPIAVYGAPPAKPVAEPSASPQATVALPSTGNAEVSGPAPGPLLVLALMLLVSGVLVACMSVASASRRTKDDEDVEFPLARVAQARGRNPTPTGPTDCRGSCSTLFTNYLAPC